MDTCPIPQDRGLIGVITSWPFAIILSIALCCVTAVAYLIIMDPFKEPEDNQRRLPNTYGRFLSVSDPEEELRKCLDRIVTQVPPESIDRSKFDGGGGLLIGTSGTAYLFLNVSRLHPDLVTGGKKAIEWVPLYLGQPPTPASVEANTCGISSNELSYCAVAAAYHQSPEWVDRFLSHLPSLTNPKGEFGVDEFVYGRAGVLYLLRLMAHWYPASAEKIKPWYKKVIDVILAHGPPWPCFGKDYVGTGHGRAGILSQIILTDHSYVPKLESVLGEILDWQLPNGNFASHAPGEANPRNYLVQWCHGAPGLIQTLTIVRPFYPSLQPRIDKAIDKARNHVWEKGLIRKSPNQCHGITGNAMVSFPPGKERMHFLAHTSEAGIEKFEKDGMWENADYDFPYSLFTGWVSRAVGWLWYDKGKGVFMGFDDV